LTCTSTSACFLLWYHFYFLCTAWNKTIH
jgi:hypothetical protein